MLSLTMKKFVLFPLVQRIMNRKKVICMLLAYIILNKLSRVNRRQCVVKCFEMITRMSGQASHLNRLYLLRDSDYLSNIRMDRNTFERLCILLRDLRGLTNRKYVLIGLGSSQEVECSQTVSRYVHLVLKLNNLFLVTPTPVPDDSVNTRWKWFKGCLGALDGTYIDVQLSPVEKGSTSDSRVLIDVVSHPHGLKVLKGNYYLCDNGYTNSEGFLSPYIEEEADQVPIDDSDIQPPDIINNIESSAEINLWREELALSMHNIWRARG
ncbi:hypothetical protein ACS0TY_013013 [Phlomoides rotata]